jgi:hypothetical protein
MAAAQHVKLGLTSRSVSWTLWLVRRNSISRTIAAQAGRERQKGSKAEYLSKATVCCGCFRVFGSILLSLHWGYAFDVITDNIKG